MLRMHELIYRAEIRAFGEKPTLSRGRLISPIACRDGQAASLAFRTRPLRDDRCHYAQVLFRHDDGAMISGRGRLSLFRRHASR